MNILIIEDNANDRRLLRYTFEHHGCTVIEARDGLEGLDLAISHQPDIIVSDALMPRMDGFQLLWALKADPHLKSIPFLFYSATYTGEQEEKFALSLGAEGFMAKPAEPEELWEKTCVIMKACEARQKVPAHLEMVENKEKFLREYGRIVASKLEKKVRELEEALDLRKQAEDELRRLNAELSREIMERKLLEEELHRLSIVDELTGLYNRRGFLTLSGQQLKFAERINKGIFLLFIDLDYMKWINDSLGHQEGDTALVETAAILRQTFRKSDIIGRMGGDEFAVLAIETAHEEREPVTRLRDVLESFNTSGTRSYKLSLSVGTAYFDPENPISLDELIARADNLMYEEKKTKRQKQAGQVK